MTRRVARRGACSRSVTQFRIGHTFTRFSPSRASLSIAHTQDRQGCSATTEGEVLEAAPRSSRSLAGLREERERRTSSDKKDVMRSTIVCSSPFTFT